MESILYNYTGFLTNNLKNYYASKIQKAYRSHKLYEINRRIDLIKNKIPVINTMEQNEVKEEIEYWNLIRNSIKSGYGLIKNNGWEVIE
tara:strand:+ start:9746 stop:10012 length:267 start_codon:yes stop_codon:yes gene_type:complete